MKRPCALKKARRVFSFWDGFETPVDQISKPETASPAPALLFVSGWVFAA
jgi:hypothetical protein